MKQKTASKLNHLCLALTRCYGKNLAKHHWNQWPFSRKNFDEGARAVHLNFRWQYIPRLQNAVGPARFFLLDLAGCKDISRDRKCFIWIPRW